MIYRSELPAPPRPVPLKLFMFLLADFLTLFGGAFMAIAGFAGSVILSKPQELDANAIVPSIVISLFSIIGFAIAISGIRKGLRRAALLSNGRLAKAKLTICHIQPGRYEDGDEKQIPFAEYRRMWSDGCLPNTQAIPTSYGKPITPEQFERRTSAVMVVISIGRTIIIGFIAVFILYAMYGVLVCDEPFTFNNKPSSKEMAACFFGGMLVFLAVFYFLSVNVFRSIHSGLGVALGRTTARQAGFNLNVDCEFEFTMHNSQIVAGRDTVLLSARMGDESEEAVLYNPRNPKQAFLIDSAALPIQMSPDGRWLPPPGMRPWLNALAACALIIGGPCLLTATAFGRFCR